MGKVINQVTKVVQERVPFPLRNRFTNLCPGIRCGQALETGLLGPTLEVSMYCCSNSPTAVKVADVTPWVHHMRVKRAYHADLEDAEQTTQKDPTDLCETKIILKKKQR